MQNSKCKVKIKIQNSGCMSEISAVPFGGGKMNRLRKIFLMLLAGLSVLWNFQADAQNNPPLQVVIYDSAATSGFIFTAPYVLSPPYSYDHPQMILDKYGNTVYYRVFMNGGIAATTADFKLQPNGLMSFYSPVLGRFYLMDSTFTVVDSVVAINGFDTDTHELQILPDGHYLILGRETRTMDLRGYHWFGPNHNLPGSATAQVTGVVVQELDQNKNLVFEWKGHDEFSFGDVDSVWLSSPSNVDWTHSNALERDYDGNILLSSRHLNEITKINRLNGNIIWRLGGKNNDFTFVNDTVGFTGQHDIRRHADGHISLWDNGQFTDPPVGRALEYVLDETDMTAQVVFGYIQDSGMFSYAMGNHQRLTGNDHFLTYGFINPPYPMMVHIHNDSTKVMEIFGPPGYGCYRSFHYDSLPFTIARPVVQCQKTGDQWFLVAEAGHGEYLWSTGATTRMIQVNAPGKYQVFVPYGSSGYAGSEVQVVININDPCNLNPVPGALNVQNDTVVNGESNCYHAVSTIRVAGNGTMFVVQSGGDAGFIAGQRITFAPGSVVENGGYLNARITTDGEFCSQPPSAPEEMLPEIKMPAEEMQNIKNCIRLYPNPSRDVFRIISSCDWEVPGAVMEIHSLQGGLISRYEIPDLDDASFTASHLTAGVYLVRVLTAGKVVCLKLVRNP